MRTLRRLWNRSLVRVLLPLAPYSAFLVLWVEHNHAPLEAGRVLVCALSGIALGLAIRPRASEIRRTDDHFCYYTRPPAVSIW